MRAIALLCVALALGLASGSREMRVPAQPFAFEVEVSSSVAGRIQVYFDTGKSFSEPASVSAQLAASSERTLVRLPMPEGVYHAIRFDPIDRSGTVTFAHARITTANGSVVRALPGDVFAPNDQIEAYTVTRQLVSFRVPTGRNDPNLTVTFDPGLRLRFGWAERLSLAARAAIGWFFVWLALLGAVSIAWIRRAHLTAAAQRHPQAAIWICAVIAAIVATYPVVFCDKSFVSPNTNALLRSSPPTVPGYTDLTRTDVHAADDSAVLWQNLPYSVLQHDAIFRDHELPLWNRDLSCGVTLLGQGQSMLGDPIHLLVIAARGASWAWDVKFVAARAIYAAGVATTVWVLTGDLSVALLAIFAAAFVAFFNFRFNHPAIFSFAYSVWILAGWALMLRAASARALRLPLAIWLVANVALIGSGTAKEAYMLLATLNACGVVWWLWQPAPPGVDRFRRNLAIGLTLGCGIAVTMPLWLPFFDALRQGTNVYVKPTVWQAPRAWLIGLFDDLFYVETNPSHRGFIPSANVLVLLGVLFAILRPGRRSEPTISRAVAVLTFATIVAVLLAHEFVPARWIAATPVLRNIYHVHNTFDAVAVVLLTVIAGCGFHIARTTLTGPKLARWVLGAAAVVGALLAVYFYDLRQVWMAGPGLVGWIAGIRHHVFFYGNVGAMLAACAVLVTIARRRLQHGRFGLGSMLLAVLALSALLYRHGLHVDSLVGSSYLSVPMPRADLAAPSLSIEQMRAAEKAPFRVVGTDVTLISGWNAMYRLEGLNGPDAIMNVDYRDLLVTAGLIPPADWRLQLSPSEVDGAAPVLDMLGIRYVVTEAALKTEHYAKFARVDVNVYRSESTWPRAFFSTGVATYTSTPEFLNQVRAARAPFAAVDRASADAAPLIVVHKTSATHGRIIAATDFKLTANTTTFRINAPSAGVVVLHETWLPDDFRATVDGRPVSYFRVNRAFKGVLIDSAGSHVVSFAYWPRHLTMALWFAVIGAAAFVGALCVLSRRPVADQSGPGIAG